MCLKGLEIYFFSPFGKLYALLWLSLNTMKTTYKMSNISKRGGSKSMTKARNSTTTRTKRKIRPALSPEARENQMIALAVDLAEKQLMEGTASSQVITHFLKLGTTKAELEREKLANENELLRARTEAIQSSKKVEELYTQALNAMRNYGGQGDPDEY